MNFRGELKHLLFIKPSLLLPHYNGKVFLAYFIRDFPPSVSPAANHQSTSSKHSQSDVNVYQAKFSYFIQVHRRTASQFFMKPPKYKEYKGVEIASPKLLIIPISIITVSSLLASENCSLK